MKGANKRLAMEADVPTFYLVTDQCDHPKTLFQAPYR